MVDSNNTSRLMTAAALLMCAAGVVLLPACRGDRSDKPPRQFFPDMDDSPKFKNQSDTQFFTDGRKMRPAVAGSVAFGERADAQSIERARFLKEDPSFYLGKDANGEFLVKAPIALTQEMLLRGEERFNIYCASCHGYDGFGKGLVGQKWAYPLPNFHDPKYSDPAQQTGRDGYIFHTVRNGVLNPDGTWKMPPYAHAVKEEDAWLIVAHFRVLQQIYLGQSGDVPEPVRQKLNTERPPAPPAPEATPEATPAATPEATPAATPGAAPAPAATNPPAPPTTPAPAAPAIGGR